MSHFWYNKYKVYYCVEGKGRPIVLLNGIMMSTKSWQPFVNSFTKNNQLIRVDFLDQGGSDRLEGNYTHEIQVDLVKALIDHLNLDKVNIVGISYGGEIALEFAIKYKENVDRMVVYNTTSRTSEWLRDIGRGWILAGRTRNPDAYYNVAIPVIYSPIFYQQNIEWMEQRRNVLKPVFSDPEFLDRMERLTNSSEPYDITDKLSEIEAYTLIISAEEDYLTPVKDQELLQRQIENASWVKIPGAGHASMYEKPLLFMTFCLGFINTADTNYLI